MLISIFSVQFLIRIGFGSVTQLTSSEVYTQTLDTNSKLEFGFGSFFSYSPIPYYITNSGSDNQQYLFLGALIQKQTNKRKILHFCDIQVDNQKIIHKFKLETGQLFEYEINNPKQYEGRWHFYYIKYSTITKSGTIQISDVSKANNKIFTIPSNLQIDQSQYIIQYTGIFQDDTTKYSYFYGLIYLINQSSDFTVTESKILQDASSAKYTCYTDYDVQNLSLEFLEPSLKQYKVAQACSDYSIESWIRIINLPIYSYWEAELFQVAHNKFEDYFAHAGGNAFKLKYIYNSKTINLNVQTYSYSFPSLIQTQTQIDADIVQHTFNDINVDLLKWHFFRFKKISTNVQFQIYYPERELNLMYDFGKLYQFSRPFFTYYLGQNPQNTLSYGFQLSNFTIYNKYTDKAFQVKCYSQCKTCTGPTLYHCSSCYEGSHRILKQNKCVCELGYVENYRSCNYPPSTAFNISAVKIDIKQEGYEATSPELKCQLGYFPYQNQCLKCPQPITDHFIGCYNCVIRFLTSFFYQGFTCKTSLIKNGLSFILTSVEVITYRYNMGELVPLVDCLICTMGTKSCFRGIHTTENDQGQYCDSKSVQQDEYCYRIYPQIYKNVQCGQFCEICDEYNNLRCFRCQNPEQYFITSDGINCELCTIPNCKYCTLEDTENQNFEIYSVNFNTINRDKDSLRIVCSRCQDEYIFNYQTMSCEKGTIIPNCDLYYKDSSQSIQCILSTSLQYSNTISKCQSYISHCQFCTISQYTLEALCLQCELYYSDSGDNICSQCDKNTPCFLTDSDRRDNWKLQIKPYYYNKYSITDLIEDKKHYKINSINKDGCDQIDIYNNDCLQCKSDDYAIIRSSLDEFGECKTCSYLCQACDNLSDEEIYAINPQLTYIDAFSQKYKSKCFQKTSDYENVYIDSNFRPILCEDNQPCKNIGINEVTYTSCIRLLMALSFRSVSSFDSNIDKLILAERGISIFKYEWTLNSPSKCPLTATIWSTLQTYILTLKETQFILKGAAQNPQNQLTASFQVIELTYFCLKDFVLLDQSNTPLVIQHSTLYTDIDLLNNIFKDWTFNQPIKTQNLRNLNLINNTFIDFKFSGQSIFTFTQTYQLIESIIIEDITFQNCELNDSYFINLLKTDISQQFKLKLNNVKIKNCIFKNFIFFNLMIEQVDIQINNLEFENITTYNFSFINGTFTNICSLQNLQLLSSKIQQQSVIIKSNYIQPFNVIIKDNIFEESSFFKMTNVSSPNLIFDQYYFQTNTIIGTQPLMEFYNFNRNITILNILIEDIKCSNYEYNFYPLFLIQANIIIMHNIDIFQPNQNQKLLFYIYQTNMLKIYDINIKNIESIDKLLTTTYECFSQDDTQGIFNLVDNTIIEISSIHINNFKIVNNALFNFIFNDKYKIEIQQIQLTDISVTNTILVKTKQNIQISLFYIVTAQNLTLTFTNSNFTKIWMHHYYTDNAICSTLLTAIAPSSSFILNNLQLNNILTTNTSNSIMELDCRTITMSNIVAIDINYLNFFNFKSFFKFNFQLIPELYMEDLNQLFKIQSLGGLGNCQAEQMNFNNLSVSKVKSQSGGLFYIKTKSNGIIFLQNSKFTKIQGNLLSQVSKGGLLYIDSSTSLLSLTVINIITTETFSWQYGGLIYIIPSVEKTNILLSNSIISNSFSSQGSILYAEFQYRSTGFIILNNLTIFDVTIENFIKQLQVQNEQNTKELIQNNYLFDHKYCTEFTIMHSIISNLKYINLLNLQNTASLKIHSVEIQQIYLTNFSFIQLINSQLNSSLVLIDNLIFENSMTYNYNQTKYSVDSIDCTQYIPQDFLYNCSEDNSNSSQKDLMYYLDIYNSDIFTCNIDKIISVINSLMSITQDQSSLFKILVAKNKLYFRGTNLLANNLSVSNQGFLLILITDHQDNNLELFDSTFQNTDCGKYGCLNFVNYELANNLTNVITNITQHKKTFSQSRLRRLAEEINYVTLYRLEFIKNKAFYGAGILSLNLNINVTSCEFVDNLAKYAGGAVYIQEQSNTLITNNLSVSNNSAYQGSDFFVKGNEAQLDYTTIFGIALDTNNSISSQPVRLSIKVINGVILSTIRVEQNENIIKDQAYILPYKIYGSDQFNNYLLYPSGQSISSYTYFDTQSQTYIPYNLSLQILAFNDKFEQVVNLDGSSCNLYQKQSNGQGEFQPLPNQETVYYDTQTNSYNLDNYTFIFDPIIENDLHLIIKVKCDSILYENYELLFTVQTFQCQMGEYYFQSQCLVCDPEQSYYSLDPSKGKCDIKNDQTTLNIKSAMVQLKENYWRPMVQSSQIVYCLNNPSNCLGGWNVGDMSCKPGFIGALCEECDLWNFNGYGRFGKTIDYNCDLCEDFQYIYLKALFLVLWVYFSVFITCQSVNNSNINIKKQSALNPAFYKLLHSFSVDKTGIILKMLTNFVQIISAIQSFHISLNLNLNFAFGMVGNPVKQITTLLDCHLSLYSDFDIVYYKMILMACLVIFLIQFGVIAYLLFIYARKGTYNSSNIWVLLIFIYLFTQSGLVFDLSALLGYRDIANIKWVKGAVFLKYDTINHFLWILRVVVPITGFFQLLIPGILLFEIYHNRKRLFDFNFRKRFSYLVNEYKETAWFWEIIKLFQRTYIISNLNLYADEMLIKSTQIFLAILIYLIFLYLFQPYSQKPLIDLEIKSTIVQLCSIVLAATIYQAQLLENQIYYFYTLILILIVVIQILIFIFEISKAYFEKLKLIIENMINKKLEEGKIRLPTYLEQYFKQKQIRQAQLKMRFQKLRDYLRSQTKAITEAKSKQNQSVYPKTVQKSEYNFTDVLLSPKSDEQEQMKLTNKFKR